MDIWIILFVVAFGIAVAWMLFGRFAGKAGGITKRSMEGRSSSGREGASETSDRAGAERKMSQHGTK